MAEERKHKTPEEGEQRQHRVVDIPSAKRAMDVTGGGGRRLGDDSEDGSGISTRTWLILGGILVAIALVFLVVIPALKGYKVYAAMQDSGVPEQYLTDMQALSAAKADADMRAQAGESSAAASAQRELDAIAAKDACALDLTTCQQNSAALIRERDDALEQVEESEATIDDAARRICCVRKVDNPLIEGYEVLDGKISCVESGGRAISC